MTDFQVLALIDGAGLAACVVLALRGILIIRKPPPRPAPKEQP